MAQFLSIVAAYALIGVLVVSYYSRQRRKPLQEQRGEFLAAFTIALLVVSVPLVLVLVQQKKFDLQQQDLVDQQIAIQQQRKEAVGLVCDINGILIKFISAPPDLPRDKPALHKLRAERCDQLLRDINRTTRP